MKNFVRLFAFLAVIIFTFAACSNDDGNDEGERLPNTYTVVFNPNGGLIGTSSQDVAAGEISLTPAATLELTREGYKFLGWAITQNATTADYLDGGKLYVTKTITLYAVWEELSPNEVLVIFNTTGGNAVAQKAVQKGGRVSKPTDPTREGFTFAGWYSNAALTTAFDFTTTITTNITLYAKWTSTSSEPEEIKYYVYFDVTNLATKPSGVAKKPGEQFTQADLPTLSDVKDGYTFAGWYLDSAHTTPFAEFTVTQDNVRLYAKFTDASGNAVVTYTISYVNDCPDADNSPTTTTGYVTSANDRTGIGTTRGRDGYLFGGWFYDATYTNHVMRGDPITKDTTFYAKWVAVSSLSISSSATFGGLTYADVSSADWYTRSANKDASSGEYTYTKETAFTADRTKFYLRNGVQTISGAVIWAETMSYSITPQVENEAIDEKGLYLTNGDVFPAEESLQTSDLHQYLMLKMPSAGTIKAIVYNGTSSSITTATNAIVILLDKDGTILAKKTLDNRGSVPRTAHELTGTIKEPGDVYLAFFRNGDTTGGVYVQSISFEEAVYNVYFDTASLATKPSGIAKKYGEQFTQDDLPTISGVKDGYTFAGWYFDSNYTRPFSAFTVTEDNVRLYAKFTDASGKDVTTYTITYENEWNDGDATPSTTTGYVTTVNYRTGKGTTRGRDGYLFDGWFYDAARTNPVMRGDPITKDTTFYAKWVATSTLSLSSAATFGGLTYAEVSSADWYTRSASKNEVSGEYTYTKASSFGENTTYYLRSGAQVINGTVFWTEMTSYDEKAKVSSGAIDSKGISFTNSGTFPTENPVQISSLQQYLIFKATGAGTVTATVYNSTSSSCTTTNAVAALLDKDGNILTRQNIDNRSTSNGGIGTTSYTLTGTVKEAGNVYLVFFRNGDANGGLYVQSVSMFVQPDLDSVDAGTSQNFANCTYDDLQPAKYYTRTAEKNSETGDYDYTQIYDFTNTSSNYVEYYMDKGIQKIGDAVYWQTGRSLSVMRVAKNSSVTDSRGLRLIGYSKAKNISITDKTVSDITAFGAFVMITATTPGMVVAHVYNGTSDKITGTANTLAALVDSAGNIIDSKVVDDSDGAKSTQYTLSGDIKIAGNVYLVFTRNGDEGGGLWVQDIGIYTDSLVSYRSDWNSVASRTAKDGLITADIDVTGDGITRGREGYFFGGWFYDKDYTSPVLRGQRIVNNTTFYAKWIPVDEIKSQSTSAKFWDGYKWPSDWYKKTFDDAGNEIYSKISSFSSFEPYYMGAGARDIEGAIVYAETSAEHVSQIIGDTHGGYSGILLNQNNNILVKDTEKVDLSKVSGFIAVTTSSAGSVYVSFYNIPSSKCTTNNAVIALVDKNGKILDKQIVDNRASDNADYTYCYPDHTWCTGFHKTGFSYSTNPQYKTLSGYVSEVGNVYVVFDRNGDEDGMVRVEEISFTEESSPEFNTEFNGIKAGSSQAFVGLSYTDVSSAHWMMRSTNGGTVTWDNVNSFEPSMTYYISNSDEIYNIGGATFWHEKGLTIPDASVTTTENSITSEDGFQMQGTSADYTFGSTIGNLRNFRQFLMITASSEQKVIVTITYLASSTTDKESYPVAALIDSTGKVLTSMVFYETTKTKLAAMPTATGNVYLVFANNQDGGTLCVKRFEAY